MLHSPVIPRTEIERPSLLASIRPVYAIVPFSFRKWMPRRATLCDRRNCRFRSLQFVAPSICERSCCSVGMDRDLFLLMASHVSFSRSKTIWSAQRKFERRRIGKEEIRIRINALIFGAFRFSKSILFLFSTNRENRDQLFSLTLDHFASKRPLNICDLQKFHRFCFQSTLPRSFLLRSNFLLDPLRSKN